MKKTSTQRQQQKSNTSFSRLQSSSVPRSRKVGLAAIAGCWTRFEIHLPEVGSLEETRFVEWISARVTAHILAAIIRCSPRGIAELLKCAKDSAEVSQTRFDIVELLVNDQAQAGEGRLQRGNDDGPDNWLPRFDLCQHEAAGEVSARLLEMSISRRSHDPF